MSIISTVSKFVKKEWFLSCMFLAIGLATLFPLVGKSGGSLQIDQVAGIGIGLVFFLHGLGLSLDNLKSGMLNWRIHLVVQSFTFLVFPIIYFIANFFIKGWLPNDLLLGFVYLCALPSTVSSSVALTGIAKGNVSAAIFNATLSGLIGIVLTPIIVHLLSGEDSGSLSLPDAILGIAKLLLVPLVLGQLLRPLLIKQYTKYKAYTSNLDRFVILMLIFNAFSDSVESGLWKNNSPYVLLEAFVGALILLIIVLYLSKYAAKAMAFSTEDEIAAVFCGSKKTLASGIPMAKLIFGAHPGLGLIMLPIIFYHQVQLIICSYLANKYRAR